MPNPPRRPWLASPWVPVLVTAGALALVGVSAPGQTSTQASVGGVLAVLAVGAAGVAVAWTGVVQRRRYEATLAEAAARAAVQDDRLTIARDLHDIVSHGLGAITVRSRAGLRPGAADPGAAAAALEDVIDLSSAATADLRRLLGVLRDAGDPAPLVPAPGLADVPALVDAARRQGLTVALSGAEVRADTPGTDLAAYHVVREALANAARHAGPTAVAVRVARADGELCIAVSDDGPAPGWAPQPGAGHGLALLAHRIAAHGGTLRHGPVGAAAGLDVREAGLHGAGVPGAGTPGTPGAPGAGERGDGAGRPGYRVEATWSQGERP